jgi:DNA (cytosine-5)-methyltransferase 1
MFRVIEEIKPCWIIGENVDGIISLALDDVLTDLESKNSETRAFVLPACGVGAAHRRYRVAIVAHRNGDGGDTREREPTGQRREAGPADGGDDVGYAKHNGSSSATINGIDSENAGRVKEGKKPPIQSSGTGIAGCGDDVADAFGEQDWWLQRYRIFAGIGGSGTNVADAESERGDRAMQARGGRPRPAERRDVEHASGTGREELHIPKVAGDEGFSGRRSDANGEYQGGAAQPGLGYTPDGFSQWVGRPVNAWDCDWDNIPRIATGIPDRVNKLKALGNAVVPQQFYPVFAAIAEIERRRFR